MAGLYLLFMDIEHNNLRNSPRQIIISRLLINAYQLGN